MIRRQAFAPAKVSTRRVHSSVETRSAITAFTNVEKVRCAPNWCRWHCTLMLPAQSSSRRPDLLLCGPMCRAPPTPWSTACSSSRAVSSSADVAALGQERHQPHHLGVRAEKTISCWHEIPLYAGDGNLHYICEIPKVRGAGPWAQVTCMPGHWLSLCAVTLLHTGDLGQDGGRHGRLQGAVS